MIPKEVENRIAKYFFHMYLPDEVMMDIEGKLLPTCIWHNDDELDYDELVRWAVEIIDCQMENKRFR